MDDPEMIRVKLDSVAQKIPAVTPQMMAQLIQELESVKQDMAQLTQRLESVTQQITPLLTSSGYSSADETVPHLQNMLDQHIAPKPTAPVSPPPPLVLPAQNRPMPTHPAAQPRKQQGKWRIRLAVFTIETSYLCMAAALAYAIWIYLAPWPIYRIVAYIILVILWSNFASTTARHTSTKRQAAEIVNAVKHATTKHKALTPQEVLNINTTVYLKALKFNLQERKRTR